MDQINLKPVGYRIIAGILMVVHFRNSKMIRVNS